MSGDGVARILVVDDVPENVRLLEAVLAPRGCDVVSTTDGSAALELAVSSKPDLILLDVVMPPPDGYRRARSRWQLDSCPRAWPPLWGTRHPRTRHSTEGS
jgi:adenylate cyclase